jgi:hypothetical protein
MRRDLLNYYHGGKPGSGPGGSAVSPAPVLRPVSQASSSQPGPEILTTGSAAHLAAVPIR